MKTFLNQGLFYIVIQTIICLCVFSIFLSVFINFALFSKNTIVQKQKKSIVETGTMTLFFFVFYLILVSRLGVISVSQSFLKELLMVLGTIIIVTGCIINIKGRFNLGKNWANQINIYQEHTLVQTGMYRIVRHPLYSSTILMFYGACLAYRNAVSLIAVTAVFVPFMYYRARQEEILLEQKFPQYHEYKLCTGMLLPKILKRKERTRNERV